MKTSHVERGMDRRRRKPLSERLAEMTREQLVDEVMLMWGGWSYTQGALYKQIRDLENRIHEQRLALHKREAEKSGLALRAERAEAAVSELTRQLSQTEALRG